MSQPVTIPSLFGIGETLKGRRVSIPPALVQWVTELYAATVCLSMLVVAANLLTLILPLRPALGDFAGLVLLLAAVKLVQVFWPPSASAPASAAAPAGPPATARETPAPARPGTGQAVASRDAPRRASASPPMARTSQATADRGRRKPP